MEFDGFFHTLKYQEITRFTRDFRLVMQLETTTDKRFVKNLHSNVMTSSDFKKT